MTLGEIKIKIGADLSEAEAAFRRLQTQTEGLRDKLDAVGETLSRRVTAPLLAFGTGAVLAAGQFDRLSKGLEAVTGSSEEAARQIDRLRTIAQAPGLGFPEAVQASTSLQAVGFAAADAERSIAELGNALALTGGTKDDFAEVVRQFTQIQSLGKVTAENLNVIRERAPAVSGALQDAFSGIDVSKVPVAEFTAVLLGELEKLQRAAPSLLEPFVNGLDSLRQSLVPVGEVVARVVTPAFEGFAVAAESLSASFASLDGPTQDLVVQFGLAAAALGPLLGAAALAVGALPALAAGFALLTGPIGLAVGAIGLLTAAYIDSKAKGIEVTQGLSVQQSRVEATAGAFRDLGDAIGYVSDISRRLAVDFNNTDAASRTLGTRIRFSVIGSLADLLTPFANASDSVNSFVYTLREAQGKAILDTSQIQANLNAVTGAADRARAALASYVQEAARQIAGSSNLLPFAEGSGRPTPTATPPAFTLPSASEAKAAADPIRDAIDGVRERFEAATLSAERFAAAGALTPLEVGSSRLRALADAVRSVSEIAGARGAAAFESYSARFKAALSEITGAFAATENIGARGVILIDADTADKEAAALGRLAKAAGSVDAAGIRAFSDSITALAEDTKAKLGRAASAADAFAGRLTDALFDVGRAFRGLAFGDAGLDLAILDAEDALSLLRAEYAAGEISAQRYGLEVAIAEERLSDLRAAASPLASAVRGIGDAFKTAFADVIAQLTQAILKALALKAILAVFAPTLGGTNSIGGAFLDILTGQNPFASATTGPAPPSFAAGARRFGAPQASYATPRGGILIPDGTVNAAQDRYLSRRYASGASDGSY